MSRPEIDDALIERLSGLAAIAFSPEERGALRRDIERILDMIDEIGSVDTAHVEPLAHPLELTQPLRPDRVTEPDGRARFLPLAPSTADDLFLVPRVVE